MMTRSLLFVVAALLAGCGGDDDGSAGDDDTASPSCQVTATAAADLTDHTITGKGDVQCDAAATLDVETCVQWNPSGSFEDIMCQSASQSGMSHFAVENVSSCGINTSGRSYRSAVHVMVNGTALAEALSPEVACE